MGLNVEFVNSEIKMLVNSNFEDQECNFPKIIYMLLFHIWRYFMDKIISRNYGSPCKFTSKYIFWSCRGLPPSLQIKLFFGRDLKEVGIVYFFTSWCLNNRSFHNYIAYYCHCSLHKSSIPKLAWQQRMFYFYSFILYKSPVSFKMKMS